MMHEGGGDVPHNCYPKATFLSFVAMPTVYSFSIERALRANDYCMVAGLQLNPEGNCDVYW